MNPRCLRQSASRSHRSPIAVCWLLPRHAGALLAQAAGVSAAPLQGEADAAALQSGWVNVTAGAEGTCFHTGGALVATMQGCRACLQRPTSISDILHPHHFIRGGRRAIKALCSAPAAMPARSKLLQAATSVCRLGGLRDGLSRQLSSLAGAPGALHPHVHAQQTQAGICMQWRPPWVHHAWVARCRRRQLPPPGHARCRRRHASTSTPTAHRRPPRLGKPMQQQGTARRSRRPAWLATCSTTTFLCRAPGSSRWASALPLLLLLLVSLHVLRKLSCCSWIAHVGLSGTAPHRCNPLHSGTDTPPVQDDAVNPPA